MRQWALVAIAGVVVCVAACDRRDESLGGTRTRSPGADSLLAVGERLFAEERFDSARAVWTRVRHETAQRGDSAQEARALLSLSKVAWQISATATASALAETALSIISRRRMTEDVSTANRLLGLAALDESRNKDALMFFERALGAARAVGNHADEARAAGNMGLAYTYVGDYDRARSAHRAARNAGRAQRDLEMEGKGLANEAMVDIWEGDGRSAIARLDTARSLYRQAGYATGEEKALGQLATAYELTGEESRSLATLDTAMRLARRLGLTGEELDNQRLVAGLHLRLGDTRLALDLYRSTEARMRSAGLTANLASLLRGEAEANMRLGNLSLASDELRDALARHAAASETDGQLDDLLLMAEMDSRSGQLARAEQWLRRASHVADTLNTRGSRIGVAVAEAHLADLSGDSRRVLAVLRAAAPAFSAGDYGAEWMTAALASRAYSRIGELDSAVSAGRRAVGAVERLRGSLASEALRSSYIVDRAEVYGDLVMTLLRLGRAAEAFTVADGARSRELLRHLSASRPVVDSLGGAARALEGERLLRRIDLLVQQLRSTESGKPRERGTTVSDPSASISQSLTEARTEYESFVMRSARSRSQALAVLGARPAAVAEVQAALMPHEVILEYMIAGGRLVTFVVTRRELRVLEQPSDGRSLTQRVWLLRDLWGTPNGDWRDALPSARHLYDALIAPAESAGMLRDARRLIVVPLGALAQIPFAALVDPRGDFLVRHYEVVHLPSAASIVTLSSADAPSTGDKRGGVAFAPFPGELPATATEVESFRMSSPGWVARVGGQATEAALRRALSTDVVVHVATHGVFNVRNPTFSHLDLARPIGGAPDDDGRLEVHEILALAIRSPLVFLSGCDTGVNQGWSDDPVHGTGDLTLAQAVMAAGAPNVIMTLWRIDDVGAAELARRFYRRLGATSVATALADAQRETAADPRYASPYFWAGYTLSGRGELPSRNYR